MLARGFVRKLPPDLAEKLATVALGCVHREYPNKVSHVLNSDGDVRAPRELTPAFYGCYDWHSAVHNHWLLARLARLFPHQAFAADAKRALERSLAPANVRGEVEYLSGDGRQSFERPYGLAWLLQLAQELAEWNEPLGNELRANLRPLEQAAADRLESWLAKLERPVRTGEHNQTAFSLGLTIDYARHAENRPFLDLLTACVHRFYGEDRNWPFDYEPSGEDFLSPGLAEADVMRRVLPAPEFRKWLDTFMAQPLEKLLPERSPDRSDPKFSHLDGLNLSRAWMLDGIASVFSANDRRRAALETVADAHAEAGMTALTGEHYVGSHWLGTFAVYLMTARGQGNPEIG